MTALSKLHAALGGVPVISEYKATLLYEFVLRRGFTRCLELGVAHGKSALYIAGALHEGGGGTITAVDRPYMLKREPNIVELAGRLDLTDHVIVEAESRSCTWFLQRMLDRADPARFDFCFIDGGHTWDLDGFAFLLVDRMLEPGGWVIFDDLDWAHADSTSVAGEAWVRDMPAIEREMAQVRKVWELLVVDHPRYMNQRESGGWGFAQKIEDDRLTAVGATIRSSRRAARLTRRAVTKARRIRQSRA